MKILVAYYSKTGKTRALVQQISERLGADKVEIRLKKEYKGIIGFFKSARDAMKERPVEIALPADAPKAGGYDLVICASPVWAGRFSAPALAYLKQNAAEIKKIAYILSHADQQPYTEIFGRLDTIVSLKHCAELSVKGNGGENGGEVEAFIRQVQAL